MNCKHCKHFDSQGLTGEFDAPEGFGFCNLIADINTFRSVSDEAKDKSKAYACSEWGDAVETLVGEDFGCIHFQE